MSTRTPKLTDEQREIVEANLDLVFYHVNKFRKIYPNIYIARDVLIQYGTMGLIRAVQKHDPEKGTLSTYSKSWILSKFRHAMHDSPVVTVPIRKTDTRFKYHSIDDNVHHAGKELPDLSIIPADVQIEKKQIADNLKAAISRLSKLSKCQTTFNWPKIVINEFFYQGKTLKAIAEKYGVSRQYVFLVKEHTLKELRQLLSNGSLGEADDLTT